eukprot:tig00021012_g17000.t1
MRVAAADPKPAKGGAKKAPATQRSGGLQLGDVKPFKRNCSARPLLQQLLPRPARRPARCFSFDDSRRRAGPGATCRSARFLARRPAGCFSFVDSRLRAGPSAICRSARFPARRPAGCLSFVDSRLRAGPAARPPGAAARVATPPTRLATPPASPGRPPCLSSCPLRPPPLRPPHHSPPRPGAVC